MSRMRSRPKLYLVHVVKMRYDTAEGNEMSLQTKSSEYYLSILYLFSDIVPITIKYYHAGIEPRGLKGQHSPIIDNDYRSRAAGATTS